MKKYLLFYILMLLVFCNDSSWADKIVLNGQVSGWTAFSDEGRLGFRYIPEMKISHPLFEGKAVDAEISLDLITWAPINSMGKFIDNADAKLYRLWLRYTESQFEVRLGLQKINFGPAKILRSLMWFDQLDICDPLELTEGVYGLLGRYYFLNNDNVWLWGLYGNDNLKGFEFVKTEDDSVELGGRYQFPLRRGEFALTYNRRCVDEADWNEKMTAILSRGMENRFAIDGNWDIGIGLWFEASYGEIKINMDDKLKQDNLTIGADYTFEPGIHLLSEHFIQAVDSKAEDIDEFLTMKAID